MYVKKKQKKVYMRENVPNEKVKIMLKRETIKIIRTENHVKLLVCCFASECKGVVFYSFKDPHNKTFNNERTKSNLSQNAIRLNFVQFHCDQ